MPNLPCITVIIVFVDLQKKAIPKHNFHTADMSLYYTLLKFSSFTNHISFHYPKMSDVSVIPHHDSARPAYYFYVIYMVNNKRRLVVVQ